MNKEDEEITRPITLPPYLKCGKPVDSKCAFRNIITCECTKRNTTCRYRIINMEIENE